MGNVIADAILDKTKHLGVTAVIQNGGGVRATIGQGEVTMGQVLTVLPRVQVDPLPRMADFARILAAVDEVMGTQGLARYRERLEQVARESAHNDPVLAAIAESTAGGWRGTAAELAGRLSPYAPDGVAGGGWPRDGAKMSRYLKRVAPVACQAGWTFCDDGEDRSRKVKTWLIEPPLTTTEL
jgi:hypothetical protein